MNKLKYLSPTHNHIYTVFIKLFFLKVVFISNDTNTKALLRFEVKEMPFKLPIEKISIEKH